MVRPAHRVELGFRTLKGLGWDGERTRRSDPDRVARHWLVRAVATLLAVASGTRVEDAERLGVPPGQVAHRPYATPGGAAAGQQPVYPRPGSGWAAISGKDGCGAACGCGPSRGRVRHQVCRSPSTNRHQPSFIPHTYPCEVEPGEELVFP